MHQACGHPRAMNGASGLPSLLSPRSDGLPRRWSDREGECGGAPGFYILLVPRRVLERLVEESGDDFL
jgi:hypothetical protein